MTETTNLATTGMGGMQTTVGTQPSEPMYVVGPHSAYRTVDELFEGAKQKEAYIAKLEAENASLLQEVSKATNREQFKQELERMTAPTTTQTTVDTTIDSESKLKELVNKVLLDKAEEARTTEKMNAVSTLFGQEAEQKMEARASELGMTKEQLKALPKEAFYSLMGIKKEQSGMPSSAMQGRQGIFSQVPTDAEAFKKKALDPTLLKDPRRMADLINCALKDPSLIADLG